MQTTTCRVATRPYLGMCTTADNDDGTSHGYGSKPPAEGFDFIEGPKVPAGPADSALVGWAMVRGYVKPR